MARVAGDGLAALGMRLCVIAGALAAVPAAAEPFVLHTAGRETKPYFEYLPNGNVVGLCPQLLAALELEEPLIRFVGIERKLSWPLLEAAFFEGKATVLCAVGRTQERDAMSLDAGVVGVGKLALGMRVDDATGITDLPGLASASQADPLLVRKGTLWVKELRGAGVNVLDDATENEAMARMVAKGRARWFYTFDYVIRQSVHREGLEGQLRVHAANLGSESLHLLVSRRVPGEVQQRVVDAFARLKRRGDYARMLALYGISDR